MNKLSKRGIVLLREDFCREWLELAKEGNLNVIGLHELAPEGKAETETFFKWLFTKETQLLIREFEDVGINIEYEMHIMSYLLPRERFSDHPEWFRMNKQGNRINDFNFCVSCLDALNEVSKNAYKLAKQLNQKSHDYYFWLDDVYDGACYCEKCKDITPTDQSIMIMNNIIKDLKKYDYKARLAFLSYSEARKIPTVKPADGIFLEFAPMNRNHAKPLNTDSEPDNIRYAKLFEELCKVFDPKETHILEYWLDNALYSGFQKPPVKVPFYPEVMRKDVEFYTKFGVNFITSFGSFIGKEYFELHGKPPIKEYGDIMLNC